MIHDALALVFLSLLAGFSGWLICNQMYLWVDRPWLTPAEWRRTFRAWGGLLVLAVAATVAMAVLMVLTPNPRPLPSLADLMSAWGR